MLQQTYWAEHAWLPDGVADGVRIDVNDGIIAAVRAGTDRSAASHGEHLAGVVLPGFANVHSHAFHRALRGRTHNVAELGAETFWSWRKQMYAVAGALTPDTYLELATATYAEMALAGVTCVGEFHYVHHDPHGRAYDEPNAMGEALREAARRAGIRLTLLDTCYVAGGFGKELTGSARRFGDGDADGWGARFAELKSDEMTRIGAAIHSVRAVPAEQMPTVVDIAAGRPLHVHLSEQPAENDECLATYAATPTQLLHDHGVLGPATTAIHATHLTDHDIELLGAAEVTAGFCPTTERDLADGIGPARALVDAGCGLAVGSDQHAIIDMFEEARAVELHERLAARRRGRFTQQELVAALTLAGHNVLGWPESGALHVGALADLVAVRLDSVRTVGSDPGQIVMTASASDVHRVIVGGRSIVDDGRHMLGDVASLMGQALEQLRG